MTGLIRAELMFTGEAGQKDFVLAGRARKRSASQRAQRAEKQAYGKPACHTLHGVEASLLGNKVGRSTFRTSKVFVHALPPM